MIEEQKNTTNINLIMEQYKLYVDMADRISQRRAEANKYYISILSGILIVLAIIFEKGSDHELQTLILRMVSIVGVLICSVWFVNLQSYRQLNSGKFKVIHEMEKSLPFSCYDREWQILKEGRNYRQYFPLTHIEKYIPLIFAIPYIILYFFVI